MSAKDHFESVVRISELVTAIEAEGMKITVGTDFTAYRNLREPQFHQRPLYPMFDVNCSFIDATNGFWIAGTNAMGELVHTQAILKLNMDGCTLEEHISTHRQKYVTPGLTPDSNGAYLSVPSSIRQISGSVCYHGEFWLMGGVEGFRQQGFTALLSRLTFELAYQSWDPDFVFGLVPAAVALKGIGVRYGYFHGEPGLWRDVDDNILAEEWLVWMSNQDIARLTKREPEMMTSNLGAQALNSSVVTQLSVTNNKKAKGVIG